MLKHTEQDCNVCLTEQLKSSESDFTINRTRILEKLILPKNECWYCEMEFSNTDEQLKHFSEFHECHFCQDTFETIELKGQHEADYHCQYCKKYMDIRVKINHEINCSLKPRIY